MSILIINDVNMIFTINYVPIKNIIVMNIL